MVCGEGLRCDPASFTCRPACLIDGCSKGEFCDTSTGQCLFQSGPCDAFSCLDGFTCDVADGKCKPTCTLEGCPGGATCDPQSGYCQGDVALLPVGIPCSTHEECGPSLSCAKEESTGMPGGYCTRLCGAGKPCPGGSSCSYGVCKLDCESVRECRPGYSCVPADLDDPDGQFVCFPFGSTCAIDLRAPPTCVIDGDCKVGRCQDGQCACQPLGSACAWDDACERGEMCLDETTYGVAGGFCLSLFCEKNGCAAGSTCVQIAANISACLPDCALGSPFSCATGAACEPLPDVASDPAQSCSADADCAGGEAQDYCAVWSDPTRSLCTDPYAGSVCYPFSTCKDDVDCGACAGPEDCRAGETCVGASGTCEHLCDSDADCAPGRDCVQGLCRWRCDATSGCRGVGGGCEGDGHCALTAQYCDPVVRRCNAACRSDLDCDLVRSCDTETGRCALGCSSDEQCGAQGVCRAGKCAGRCTFTGCAYGLYCDASGAGATFACTRCTVENEPRVCGDTQRCHASGRCGAACAKDSDCGSMTCDEASGRCIVGG